MSLMKQALHAYETDTNTTCVTLEELCEWLDTHSDEFQGLKVEGDVRGYEDEK